MGARATAIFPFAIAAVLPPAGLVLAVAAWVDDDRERAMWLAATAVVAIFVWALVIANA